MGSIDFAPTSSGVGIVSLKSLDLQTRDQIPQLHESRDSRPATTSSVRQGMQYSSSKPLPSPASSNRRNSTPSTSPQTLDQNSLATAQALGGFQLQDGHVLDLVSIGMGPAALAIGIAIADVYAKLPLESRQLPKVRFLEKQEQFAWHAGMQLSDAKMQISFLKDLATPRDPTSPFSFVNYLHTHGRLNTFINLGTFLPARLEYEDYMRWCASHFEESVFYGSEVQDVKPIYESDQTTVNHFEVCWRNVRESRNETLRARHVVIAAGGRPNTPEWCKPYTTEEIPRAIHSSQYKLAQAELGAKGPQKFVVLGGGQSSAEIFNDLWDRYPESEVTWLVRAAALKPSDDSPFVNEVFDPEHVSEIFDQEPDERREAIFRDKATNYSVVRIELLEHIYQKLYMQRVKQTDSSKWTRRIINNAETTSVEDVPGGSLKLSLRLTPGALRRIPEYVEATQIIYATGYERNAHVEILRNTTNLLPSEDREKKKFDVGRDYRVKYDESRVPSTCGVWLQGCNEGTHGLSDTLLSILAIRGGEVVQSVFGSDLKSQTQGWNEDQRRDVG